MQEDSKPTKAGRLRRTIDPFGDLYVAISRAVIEHERLIAPDIELRQTYAYTFAHPMLATSPPIHERAHHPAPWHAVSTPGVIEEATVEMVLRRQSESNVDRLMQSQNIVSLIRLVAGSPVRAPICSNIPFSKMAEIKDVTVMQLEPPMDWPIHPVLLNDNLLTAIEKLLDPMQVLLHCDQFNSAFNLANSVWWLPSFNAQMIAIWAAAEALMRPGRQDMTKQLARSIRAYSGTSSGQGDKLYQRVIHLCKARGEAAHAGHQPKPEDVQESFFILRSILLRALSEGAAPGPIETITPLWNSSN
jgi:hypothetical protein